MMKHDAGFQTMAASGSMLLCLYQAAVPKSLSVIRSHMRCGWRLHPSVFIHAGNVALKLQGRA